MPAHLRILAQRPVFEFKTDSNVTMADFRDALRQAADEIEHLTSELEAQKAANQRAGDELRQLRRTLDLVKSVVSEEEVRAILPCYSTGVELLERLSNN